MSRNFWLAILLTFSIAGTEAQRRRMVPYLSAGGPVSETIYILADNRDASGENNDGTEQEFLNSSNELLLGYNAGYNLTEEVGLEFISTLSGIITIDSAFLFINVLDNSNSYDGLRIRWNIVDGPAEAVFNGLHEHMIWNYVGGTHYENSGVGSEENWIVDMSTTGWQKIDITSKLSEAWAAEGYGIGDIIAFGFYNPDDGVWLHIGDYSGGQPAYLKIYWRP